MMTVLISIAVALGGTFGIMGLIAYMNYLVYWADRDGTWHRAPHGRLMRRYLGNRTWQYRKMTDDEEEDAISSDAW